MSLRIHFCGEIAIFFVDDIAIFAEQSHCFNGEGQDGLGAFSIKPVHEAFLQPREGFPVRTRAVGEDEFSKERFKVRTVVVGDVPEHRLEIARSSGLVDGVDDLFKTIGDDLVEGALTFGEIHHIVCMEIIVFAIFFFQEMAHVHQEFHCGTSTAEHRTHDEDHIDESAAERF